MCVFRVLILGCLLSALTGAVCAQQAAERPDIVVILADDFGLLDGSPWGAPQGSTPQLQQLADAGL
ncbi:MAG: arylsulfatase, partial [Planctomycetaceae bacterium]